MQSPFLVCLSSFISSFWFLPCLPFFFPLASFYSSFLSLFLSIFRSPFILSLSSSSFSLFSFFLFLFLSVSFFLSHLFFSFFLILSSTLSRLIEWLVYLSASRESDVATHWSRRLSSEIYTESWFLFPNLGDGVRWTNVLHATRVNFWFPQRGSFLHKKEIQNGSPGTYTTAKDVTVGGKHGLSACSHLTNQIDRTTLRLILHEHNQQPLFERNLFSYNPSKSNTNIGLYLIRFVSVRCLCA